MVAASSRTAVTPFWAAGLALLSNLRSGLAPLGVAALQQRQGPEEIPFYAQSSAEKALLVQEQERGGGDSAFDGSPSDADDKNCRCMNWKDTYRYYGVSCGQGNELFVGTHGSTSPAVISRAKKSIGLEFCSLFFERMDNDYCVNVGMHNAVGQWQNGEWCYVSSKCASLNGGKHIHDTGVSWKLCGEHDKLLRDKSPEELDDLAQENDWELGLLVKMAYPMWEGREGQTWQDIVAAFGVMEQSKMITSNSSDPVESAKMEAWGRELMIRRTTLQLKLMDVIQSGQPMIFLDHQDGLPPFYVVHGVKVFKINANPGSNVTHPGTWNTMECVKGCRAR